MNPLYNFRFTPETIWLIVNTILGSILSALILVDFTTITDWKAWAIGFGFGLIRPILGAIAAAATGGKFIGPTSNGAA